MIRNFTLFACLTIAMSSIGQSEIKASHSIEQLVEIAIKTDPLYAIAKADSQIYTLRYEQTKGALLPTLDMSFDVRYNIRQQSFILPTSAFGGPDNGYKRILQGTPWNANLAFDGSMPIFNAALLANRKLAKIKQSTSMIELESRRKHLTYEISVLYVQFSTLQALDEFYRQQEDSKIGVRTAVNEKFLKGIATQIDFEQANVDVDLSHYKRELNAVQLENILSKIERITGKLETTLVAASGASLLLQTDPMLIEIAKSQRSDLKALQQNSMELQQIAHAAKWNYLPNLNLNSRLATQAFRQTFDFMSSNPWYEYSFVGLELKMNLFQGGNRVREAKIAMLEVDKSNARITDLERQAQNEVVESLNNFKLAQMELKLRNKEMEAYLLREKSMKDKIKLGAATPSDLSLLNSEYTNIVRNQLLATEQALLSSIMYKKAVGLL